MSKPPEHLGRMLLSGLTIATGAATSFACACTGQDAGVGILATSAVINSLAGLAGNSFITDVHTNLDRPVPDPDSRRWNHDILRASVLAVSDIIKKESKSCNPATAASLLRLAEAVSTHYDQIDDDSPLAVVTETEVRDSLRMGDAFQHEPSGNSSTWTAFLHLVAQGIPDFPNIPQHVMEQLGTTICRGFNNQLHQVLKFDFDAQGSPIKGRAYAAVTLDLLRHIACGNERILALVESFGGKLTRLQSTADEILASQTITKSRLREHLTSASEKALARELAVADAIQGDWKKRQQHSDAAHAAHQQRLSRVNDLADEFAAIESGENASATLTEMLRILDEQDIDAALDYLASQSSRLLAKASAKADAARADLQPLLTGAQLAIANGQPEKAEGLFLKLLAPEVVSWPQARHEYWVYLVFTKGHRQQTYGTLALALATYREAMRQATLLTLQDPENTQWQRDLSVSHNWLGNIATTQGDLTAALASYTAGLKIRETLAARDPENTEWQRDLSVSHNKLGDIAAAQGDLASARASYAADLKIAETLAARDPENTQWQRDLSVSHKKLGDVAAAQGDLAAARASYSAGLKIAETLAARDPENTEWQRDLFVSHWMLAKLAEKLDDPTEARKHWQKSHDVLDGIARAGKHVSPGDKQFLSTLKQKLGIE
jgi:tetratricopeptide (TPR) repeat protein